MSEIEQERINAKKNSEDVGNEDMMYITWLFMSQNSLPDVKNMMDKIELLIIQPNKASEIKKIIDTYKNSKKSSGGGGIRRGMPDMVEQAIMAKNLSELDKDYQQWYLKFIKSLDTTNLIVDGEIDTSTYNGKFFKMLENTLRIPDNKVKIQQSIDIIKAKIEKDTAANVSSFPSAVSSRTIETNNRSGGGASIPNIDSNGKYVRVIDLTNDDYENEELQMYPEEDMFIPSKKGGKKSRRSKKGKTRKYRKGQTRKYRRSKK